MKPPTTARLAMLAAMLPKGTAQERVKLAAEVWDHAEIEAARRRIDMHAARKGEWQDLDSLLVKVMPQKKMSMPKRLEKWEEFLAWHHGEGFDTIHAEHRANGVMRPGDLAIQFRKWAEDRTKEGRAKGGKTTASKKRQGGTPEKKTGKSKKVLGKAKPPASRELPPASSESPPASKKWVSRKQRPTMR